MDKTFWTAMGASIAAATVTALGIWTVRHFEEWGRRYSIYIICFAAGVLISVSFLHIIPEAFELNAGGPVYLLTGFLLLYLLNRFIHVFVCAGEEDPDCGIGLIPMIGIGFHSFLDGVVYSITFSVSLFTGALAATGMVLHEFPEGILTYLLLIKGGFSKQKSMLLALLAASASTPLGVLVSYPFVSRIDKSLLGALLSLAAGALVYVGATHLLPKSEKEEPKYTLLAVGSGVVVAVIIVLAK
ncbi:MAG: ZIP family metal transporter [Syntrophotaleaceae bacterium]